MDFEAEGLLDGLEGDERDGRRRLLEELLADGVEPAELRQAVADGRLALVPLERELIPADASYTLEEAAGRAGLDPAFFVASIRALGLPLPAPNGPAFADHD